MKENNRQVNEIGQLKLVLTKMCHLKMLYKTDEKSAEFIP